jgi:CCR4-NOT transcription complex subunit 9
METGTELSKTVATFIVQKILLDDAGLTYICATPERFYAVSSVLSTMVTKLLEAPSARLLKHIVRCYLRLSENPRLLFSFPFLRPRYLFPRAKDALKQCLPDALKDQTFAAALVSEDSVQKWLALLLKNLSDPPSQPSGTGSGATTLTTQSSIGKSSIQPNFAEIKRDAWN